MWTTSLCVLTMLAIFPRAIQYFKTVLCILLCIDNAFQLPRFHAADILRTVSNYHVFMHFGCKEEVCRENMQRTILILKQNIFYIFVLRKKCFSYHQHRLFFFTAVKKSRNVRKGYIRQIKIQHPYKFADEK